MITKELTIGSNGNVGVTTETEWYAFVVRPRNEKFVGKQLQQMGHNFFIPLIEEAKIYTRKVRKVQKTIIPGYVFVKVAANMIVPILMIEGVYSVVKFAGKPAVVKQREIDLLHLMTGADLDVQLLKDDFELGDQVRIVQGHLNGVVGRLIKKERKNRVVIELISVNIALVIEVPIGTIIKI